MKKIVFNVTVIVLLGLFSLNALSADKFEAVQAKLEKAMQAPVRTEAEMIRDANRKPIETLKFFGLQDDMTVVELIPGGGWYTKLLAPVLADKGKLYAALGTGRIEKGLLKEKGFGKVVVSAKDSSMGRKPGARLYHLNVESLGVRNADIVFTFRNYHNFDADGRAAMNRTAFDALKPGGVYALVDHSRRHMEGDNDENRRRIDPVLAIMEIQAAGFVLEDYTKLHYRPDDELRFEVGRKTVTGNTDRWTLKFRKPR
ncbi:MAG: class I SAM-dependent methyltransferase [Proteobacteria bacterium]|nr:class I SAM-dependent methyltransferase [Pseudomonadota bacterium]